MLFKHNHFLYFTQAKASSDENECSSGFVLKQEEMFHITPKGNLAVNGGLTGDHLEYSKRDYCVEAELCTYDI